MLNSLPTVLKPLVVPIWPVNMVVQHGHYTVRQSFIWKPSVKPFKAAILKYMPRRNRD